MTQPEVQSEKVKLQLFLNGEDVTDQLAHTLFVKCFCCDQLRPLTQVCWEEFEMNETIERLSPGLTPPPTPDNQVENESSSA